MKSIFSIVLVLSVIACSMSAQAATSKAKSSKVTSSTQLHDGCHSRYAQMQGRPCR